MIDRPKLYPNHRHQWSEIPSVFGPRSTSQVRCTVCGFEVPRSAAKLDGEMALDPAAQHIPEQFLEQFTEPAPPNTRTRCPHHTSAGQCLDHQGHQGEHQYPQEGA